jgi:sn-glycerol 3-phosphate transport system ATP-binding protein
MGRAIVRQPKAFLFDEPLSNLDAKLRIAMRIEIRKLQRRLSTTSVYVTHDQLEAMTLADILVVMNGGIVEQSGKPIEIYRRPETTFVASFIGAPPMNLLSLKQSPHIGGNSGLPADAGIVGVRPEDLSFSTGGKPEGGITLDLRVDAVERIGAETFVYGHHVDGGEILVRVPGEDAPPIGGTVTAVASRAKLHVFTADGRRRIDL